MTICDPSLILGKSIPTANVVPLPNAEKDAYAASVENQVRNLETLVKVVDRLATVQFAYYEALVKAGFDSYDARQMSADWRPSYL